MSQENVSDKVRNLQRQIAQSIKFGQKPPSLRKSEGDEGSSDEDEVPRSPLRVLAQVEAEPAKTEPKVHGAQQAGTHGTPVKSPRSKRVLPPTGTIESINLDAVPQSVPRLDNTAAKHKLSVKPKNQRISRKHRRFTQDLQEISLPDVVQEDLEAAGISADGYHRMSAEEPLESLENSKKQRLHEEERQETRRKRELEEQRLRQEEEENKRRAEELRLRELEEERCRKQEEERIRREEEERKLREEAERRRWEEEERRIREEEERRRREEEERIRQEEEDRRMREELERRQREEEEKRLLEEKRRKEEEEEERKKQEEEERRQQELEAERLRLEKKLREEREEEERQKKLEKERQQLQEMEERKKLEAEERKKKEEEQKRLSSDEADASSDPQERKRRAEELRWREMEERQRPFSFKVSSGEKQILFQKVNLTPVTPASSHQSSAAADQRESTKASSPEGADSPNLPTSPYVPHTAILVTGAQLCGTAVNLDQIKDTACKSLLGLGEDRKALGTPTTKSKTSPDRKSGKTKSLNESSISTDQSSAAVLAEWASIRSKIFKGAEEGKYEDYPDPTRNQSQPTAEDLNQPPFSHTNLRKTMSASAKFSITPAKKKFGDSNRNSEVLSPDDKEATPSDTSGGLPAASPASTSKTQNRTSKTVRITERGSEECMFAKDLPSFLVPSPGAKSEGAELKARSQGEAEDSESREEGEEGGQDSEEKPSPFGIKLRRTNYSLRFHSEQSTEKRKKRYSAGDSFDGVPSPLTPIEPDSDASSVFSDKSSPISPQKESAVSKYLQATASPVVSRAKPGRSPAHSESEKVLSKPPLYQRPPTSPKPTGAVTTPPHSPLPKVAGRVPSDSMVQRVGGADSSSQEQTNRSEESSAVAQLHRSSHGQIQGEEEPKEKRSFFPSINIPWREKVDRKTELIRREKPSLQSRHSLDSARVQEKEAGPLWITLALQKQKGFREQQQNREERRSQREAKLAEKQSRERESAMLVSPTDGKGNGSTSPSKPQTPEEPKRPDSLLGRFERRDHLKKANTLPSSVTVEIADSTPSPPAVKEVSKRFPSSDSPQVSTEPAWLALAKRKAKAWSDCPQIIK
ncbi:capping protein inhibiting regulator of actin dynamics isoform X2 [Myripristis murdjan]|uniref:capping protein inhibiting regulator of actin dynamics isoform X2 n=1 Tax=Myripristis murdjan TaxID=586833 RepID=UPI0011764476|nr:cancer-related regulator of actin dynamics isoform X2 [Myripristis murdjan]